MLIPETHQKTWGLHPLTFSCNGPWSCPLWLVDWNTIMPNHESFCFGCSSEYFRSCFRALCWTKICVLSLEDLKSIKKTDGVIRAYLLSHKWKRRSFRSHSSDRFLSVFTISSLWMQNLCNIYNRRLTYKT